MLPLGLGLSAVVLFFAGLGVGPLFPNMIHLTTVNFGKNVAVSIMGLQMTSTYIGIMTMPPLFGMLAQKFGVAVFPYFQFAMFGIYMLGLFGLRKNLNIRKHGEAQ
jgi:fucose permease